MGGWFVLVFRFSVCLYRVVAMVVGLRRFRGLVFSGFVFSGWIINYLKFSGFRGR